MGDEQFDQSLGQLSAVPVENDPAWVTVLMQCLLQGKLNQIPDKGPSI